MTVLLLSIFSWKLEKIKLNAQLFDFNSECTRKYINGGSFMGGFISLHNFVANDDELMMNCFCGMVDQRKTLGFISSRDHCQRFSPSQISDTPQAGFEPAQNLSSHFVEWSCAVVITTIPWHYSYCYDIIIVLTCWQDIFW